MYVQWLGVTYNREKITYLLRVKQNKGAYVLIIHDYFIWQFIYYFFNNAKAQEEFKVPPESMLKFCKINIQ